MNSMENCQSLLNDIGVTPDDQVRLDAFMDILWEANSEMNLFSRKMSRDDLTHLHLYDSLLGLEHVPLHLKFIADLGTGGGFPAIPLAICRPGMEFTLIEKSPKKAKFLNSLKCLVPNIRVVCGQVPAGIEEKTDLVIARAFKALPVILELTQDYLKRGGAYLLWQARIETVEAEVARSQNILKKYTGNLKIVPLSHPTRDVERHLIQIN